MLDIKFIRENPEKVKETCAKKNINVDVDLLISKDVEKRSLLTVVQNLKAEQNKLGKDDIGKAKLLKAKIKESDPVLAKIEEELIQLLRKLPNIPFDDVPVGKSDAENIVLRKEGKLPVFTFTPKEHFELGEVLDIIDLERAAKIAGSRFYFLKNEAAVLEMALVNFLFST